MFQSQHQLQRTQHSPGGEVGLVGSLRRRLGVLVGAPVAVVVLVPLVAAVHGAPEARINKKKSLSFGLKNIA